MIRIINIILIVLLLIIGIDTILKFKKSEGKEIEKIRKPFLIRINIILVLIISISILSLKMVLNKYKEADVLKMVNPITEVATINEMSKYLGFTPITLDKEVDKYIVIGTGEVAEHARIIYTDGSELDMEKGKEDVSGIYGGVKVKSIKVNNASVTINKYENIYYATWSDKKYSYSLSSNNEDSLIKDLESLIK